MSKKIKSSTIADFSERVVSHAELPYGCELEFKKLDSGRRKRSDFTIKRRHVTSATLPIPDDTDTVATFLDAVRALVSTDLAARRISMKLVGPDDKVINGLKKLGTVRAMPAKIREDIGDARDIFRKLVVNADVDLSPGQADQLYSEIAEFLSPDGDFDRALAASFAKIDKKYRQGPSL